MSERKHDKFDRMAERIAYNIYIPVNGIPFAQFRRFLNDFRGGPNDAEWEQRKELVNKIAAALRRVDRAGYKRGLYDGYRNYEVKP